MPVTAEEEWKYWDTKATELRRTQLTTVQTAATKWSAVLTALLGVFGTVAFAGGLTTIDKLPSPWDAWAKVLTTLAAITAVIAIGILNRAAGGLSITKYRGLSAATVRDINTTGAAGALGLLKIGRYLAVATASLVLAGSLLVLWVREREDVPSVPTVLAVVDQELICGELASTKGRLTIDGKPADTAIFITPVSACP
jgi:hypothetical protein